MQFKALMCWTALVLSVQPLAGFAQAAEDGAASSAPAASPDFWIPFQASPHPGTLGGKSGLLLVPSGSLNTAPAPVFVNSRASNTFVAYGTQAAEYGSAKEVDTVGTLIYAGPGNDGRIHLYGLNLKHAATVPLERQVGTLSLASVKDACVVAHSQTDLTDPTTLFIVVDVPAAKGCFGGGDKLAVVHFTDDASQAPTDIGITPTRSPDAMTPLYLASGKLAGMLYLDASIDNLDFYANDGFSHPTTIVGNATSYSSVYPNGKAQSAAVVVHQTGGASSIYLVDASGKKTAIYTGEDVGQIVADAQNAYFLRYTTGPRGDTTTIDQAPLNGSGKTVELCAVGPPSFESDTVIGSLVFSSGKDVLYFQSTTDLTNDSTDASISLAPIGQVDGCGRTIWGQAAGPNHGNFLDSLYFASPTRDPADSKLFASQYFFGYPQFLKPPGYSDSVGSLDGAEEATTTGAIYLFGGQLGVGLQSSPVSLNLSLNPAAPSVYTLELTGIDNSSLDYHGAEFESVALATLASRALKTSTKTVYRVPNGYTVTAAPVVNGPIGTVTLVSKSNTFSAAVDLSAAAIMPIEFADTNVVPFL